MYTYIPISPSSRISLPPSLSHPYRWSQSTELISLCYAAASHQLSILHFVVYICPCYSLTSSQLPLPPPCVLKSILYVCVFIPVLPLGSSEPFFFFVSIQPVYVFWLEHLIHFSFMVIIDIYVSITIFLIVLCLLLQVFSFSCVSYLEKFHQHLLQSWFGGAEFSQLLLLCKDFNFSIISE